MEIDIAAAQAGAQAKTLEPVEKIIGPGEAASGASVGDSKSDSRPEYDSEGATSDEITFHPHRMTLSTFRRLLSCYQTTVEQVHRRKAMLKLQPKPEKGPKRKAEKKTNPVSASSQGAVSLQKTEFTASEEEYIKEETDKLLKLDRWRYEEMPKIMGERREKKNGEVLNRDDLITVMEWKTKHGTPRPTLMGMVKSNQNKNVIQCSSTAMAALSTEDPILAPNEAFPRPSIDAFGPLRGVGVATASLILSMATATGNPKQQVPFYSDDVFAWLCLQEFPEPEEDDYEEEEDAAEKEQKSDGKDRGPRSPNIKLRYPNSELKLKYTIGEYRKLWDASWELHDRLNRAVEAESKSPSTPISHTDIEKTGYVLRNIALSGYFEGQGPKNAARTATRQKVRDEAALKVGKAEKVENETRGRNVKRRKV
ncbi:hypothetical protein PMG11_09246 [Penicillium brasilianum]|uniref:Uncharacterized protein n=1 Tax=Penicillium brasilianum TaxID=104259 RepID=A0A0F7TXM5_PENBI|nr:hypothetical protein PMG11_09246 [Penicillium brasilianum]